MLIWICYGPKGWDYVYFIMLLSKKYVATAFLPQHPCGKLDLPTTFIFIFSLSSYTEDPSPILLGSTLHTYIAAKKLGTQGITSRFPASEEPLREFIKWFSVPIELGGTLRESINYRRFSKIIFLAKVTVWFALKVTVTWCTAFVNVHMCDCISAVILLQESLQAQVLVGAR